MTLDKASAVQVIETKLGLLSERLAELDELTKAAAIQQEKINGLLLVEKTILTEELTEELTKEKKISKLLKVQASLDIPNSDLKSLQSRLQDNKSAAIQAGIESSHDLNAFRYA